MGKVPLPFSEFVKLNFTKTKTYPPHFWKENGLKKLSLMPKQFLVSWKVQLKVALSGMRQFFVTEIPLKMKKNTFYFILKALFILKMFKFISWLFGHVEKQVDWEDEINFKI